MAARFPLADFVVIAFVYAVAIFYGLIRSVATGNWQMAVVFALLASPVVMFLTRLLVEHGSVANMFNYQLQSWTFLAGDIVALPFAFAMAAMGWRALDQTGAHWYTGSIWMIVSAAIGLLAGYAFHVMDTEAYKAAGAAAAVTSPTKLVHDFVAYPVLFGAIVYVGLPLIVRTITGAFPYVQFELQPFGILMLIGLGGWFGLGVLDGLVHHPKPADMHPSNFVWG